jgi:hypothetical protein
MGVCGCVDQTLTELVGSLTDGGAGYYGGHARCSWILAPATSRILVHHDSCEYAHDGKCDEPRYCAYGTDSSDCAVHGDSCQDANNGVCDEEDLSNPAASFSCSTGTDWSDCLKDGDYCQSAGDGTCDEPSSCKYGTDTSDCNTVSLSVAEIDLR